VRVQRLGHKRGGSGRCGLIEARCFGGSPGPFGYFRSPLRLPAKS
jgi:hypothetical protein